MVSLETYPRTSWPQNCPYVRRGLCFRNRFQVGSELWRNIACLSAEFVNTTIRNTESQHHRAIEGINSPPRSSPSETIAPSHIHQNIIHCRFHSRQPLTRPVCRRIHKAPEPGLAGFNIHPSTTKNHSEEKRLFARATRRRVHS